MISDTVASEMGKILKVATEHVDEAQIENTCVLKLWCCHPSDDRAECLGEATFDDAEDGQAALFSPEDAFDVEDLKQAEYIELICKGEDPVLRKNPDYAPTGEHHDDGVLEVVLVKGEDDCSDANDGATGRYAKLISVVSKVASDLEKIKSPLTVKADQVLLFTQSLFKDVKFSKEAMNRRDFSNLFGGLPRGTVIDEGRRIISVPLFVEDEEEGEYETVVDLPYKYVICDVCDGHGKHVNPSIDSHGITESERAEWEPEEWDNYMGGAYDQTCNNCRGTGKAIEVDTKNLTAEQKKDLELFEEQNENRRRMDLEEAKIMRMERGEY